MLFYLVSVGTFNVLILLRSLFVVSDYIERESIVLLDLWLDLVSGQTTPRSSAGLAGKGLEVKVNFLVLSPTIIVTCKSMNIIII